MVQHAPPLIQDCEVYVTINFHGKMIKFPRRLGDYTLGKQINRGAFGTIFECKDTATQT